jgi:ABC-type glycerol-3-phosphate transport system permease component
MAGNQLPDWMETVPGTVSVTTLPILVVYPFLQRYFIAGIRLDAVKG